MNPKETNRLWVFVFLTKSNEKRCFFDCADNDRLCFTPSCTLIDFGVGRLLTKAVMVSY